MSGWKVINSAVIEWDGRFNEVGGVIRLIVVVLSDTEVTEFISQYCLSLASKSKSSTVLVLTEGTVDKVEPGKAGA